MKLQVLEKTLREQIESRIRDVTPGVVVRAYQSGRLVVDLGVGETWPYYDLASLTKIVFTAQRMMADFEAGKWNFETTVGQFLPWFPHPEVRLADILTHSAGFVWWLPIYRELDLTKTPEGRREQLKGMLKDLKIEKQDQSVYSDIGMIVLGFVLEEMHQKPLLEIWNDTKAAFYDGTTLEFHPGNEVRSRASLYAPTEECPWRKKLLQGEVHDDNTWALGGVSTHAGLFGSIDDMGWYLLHLRALLLGVGRSSIRSKTARLFAQRARPEGKGDWALGFMMPTPGSASCGSYFNLASIGHTGFTGTSLWYDPKQDLAIAILSNRVLYGRDSQGFKQLRPEIHNWVVEGLRKSSY